MRSKLSAKKCRKFHVEVPENMTILYFLWKFIAHSDGNVRTW